MQVTSRSPLLRTTRVLAEGAETPPRKISDRLMRPSRSRTSAASSAGRGCARDVQYPSRSRVPRTAPTTQCRYTYRRQIRPLHTYARPFAQQFPRLTSAPTSAAPQRGGGVGAQLPLPTASSGRVSILNIGILGGLPAPHANNSDHAKMTPLTNQAPELSISFCRPLLLAHAGPATGACCAARRVFTSKDNHENQNNSRTPLAIPKVRQ